jgi:hypothetical protein
MHSGSTLQQTWGDMVARGETTNGQGNSAEIDPQNCMTQNALVSQGHLTTPDTACPKKPRCSHTDEAYRHFLCRHIEPDKRLCCQWYVAVAEKFDDV